MSWFTWQPVSYSWEKPHPSQGLLLLPFYHFMQGFSHLFFTLTYFPDLFSKVVALVLLNCSEVPWVGQLICWKLLNVVSYHTEALGCLDTLVLAPDSTVRQTLHLCCLTGERVIMIFPSWGASLQVLTWRKDDPLTDSLPNTWLMMDTCHVISFPLYLFTTQDRLQVCVFNKYKFNSENFGLLFFSFLFHLSVTLF